MIIQPDIKIWDKIGIIFEKLGLSDIHNYFAWFHEDVVCVASVILTSLRGNLHIGRKLCENLK